MTEAKYDTLMPRFLAGWVDGLIFLPVGVLSVAIFSFTQYWWLSLIWLPFHYTLGWLYSVLGHRWYGQTVGKYATKVKVVDDVTEGPITMRQAVLRDIGYIVANVAALILDACWVMNNDLADYPAFQTAQLVLGYTSFAWATIEIVSCVFSKKRRAVHDLIAGTVVVRTEIKAEESSRESE